ncbi:tetratricopeptide repeat protein [Amycolatopsis mediterranei]|uniref:tetratricopeptide repeat protein n=1 Tax=Amycolatopsis mediterranei TaxID=33910 RepID=UPI0034329E6C
MPEDTDSLPVRVNRLRDEDRYDEALPILREAFAAGEPEAARLYALSLMETGNYPAARDVLVEAVHKRGQVRLAGLLGDVADDLDEPEVAEPAYLTAIAAEDEEALNDYGVFLRGQERYPEAVEVLERAIAQGDNLAATNLVSLYFDDLGDLYTAERLALRYLNEEHPSTYVALANVHAEQGRLDEAEAAFREAIRLDAPLVHQNYALFLWQKRADTAGAEREFRLAEDSDEPGWGYELGSFLVEQDRRDEALDILAWAASWGDVEAGKVLAEIDPEGHAEAARGPEA